MLTRTPTVVKYSAQEKDTVYTQKRPFPWLCQGILRTTEWARLKNLNTVGKNKTVCGNTVKHSFWGEQFHEKLRYLYITIKVDPRFLQEEI